MRRVSRIIALSAPTLLIHASSTRAGAKQCFTTLSVRSNFQNLQERAIPGDFLKWGSLGFCRNSRFATGFSPLQPKPLDSIMDVERAKDRSPEDLASIWDDVMLKFPYFFPFLIRCYCNKQSHILFCFVFCILSKGFWYYGTVSVIYLFWFSFLEKLLSSIAYTLALVKFEPSEVSLILQGKLVT